MTEIVLTASAFVPRVAPSTQTGPRRPRRRSPVRRPTTTTRARLDVAAGKDRGAAGKTARNVQDPAASVHEGPMTKGEADEADGARFRHADFGSIRCSAARSSDVST